MCYFSHEGDLDAGGPLRLGAMVKTGLPYSCRSSIPACATHPPHSRQARLTAIAPRNRPRTSAVEQFDLLQSRRFESLFGITINQDFECRAFEGNLALGGRKPPRQHCFCDDNECSFSTTFLEEIGTASVEALANFRITPKARIIPTIAIGLGCNLALESAGPIGFMVFLSGCNQCQW